MNSQTLKYAIAGVSLLVGSAAQAAVVTWSTTDFANTGNIGSSATLTSGTNDVEISAHLLSDLTSRLWVDNDLHVNADQRLGAVGEHNGLSSDTSAGDYVEGILFDFGPSAGLALTNIDFFGIESDEMVLVYTGDNLLNDTVSGYTESPADLNLLTMFGDGAVGDLLTINPAQSTRYVFVAMDRADASGAADDRDIVRIESISAETVSANVPEPSAIALFGLGLFGLGFASMSRPTRR